MNTIKALSSVFVPLNDDEKSALWQNAIFVLDTNVLLSLYRYGHATRAEVINVVRKNLKGRIWLPHHVCLEFFRNRMDLVVDDSRRLEQTSKRLTDVVDAFADSLADALSDAKLKELGCEALEKDLQALGTEAKKKIDDRMAEVAKASPQLKVKDDVLQLVEEVVGEQIGKPPPDQAAVDKLVQEADQRYARKQPPGYKDLTTKGDDAFTYGGLCYRKAAGDYIIWKQLLEQIASDPKGCAELILVTGEQKEDWWDIRRGQTIGPRVELIEEARRAGAKRFHMYSFVGLLERLGKEHAPPLTKEALNEVKRTELTHDQGATSAVSTSTASLTNLSRLLLPKSRTADEGFIGHHSQRAVEAWLAFEYPQSRIVENQGFPDFLVRTADDDGVATLLGVEVITPRNPEHLRSLALMHLPHAEAWIDAPRALEFPRRRLAFAIALQPPALRYTPEAQWISIVDDMAEFLRLKGYGVYFGISDGTAFKPTRLHSPTIGSRP